MTTSAYEYGKAIIEGFMLHRQSVLGGDSRYITTPPLTLTLDPPRVDALPVVHTCFNQIVLSNFTSYATMKKQCAFAIRNCATFELS